MKDNYKKMVRDNATNSLNTARRRLRMANEALMYIIVSAQDKDYEHPLYKAWNIPELKRDIEGLEYRVQTILEQMEEGNE